MNLQIKILKKILLISTSVLAGISIFAALTTFNVDKTLFNSNFHKDLFVKNDIYSHAQEVINTRMKSFINTLKKTSPENFKQYNQVFLILEKSLTPEMIKLNLDSVRNGLFNYFEGSYQFLPDIYLSKEKQTTNTKITEEDKADPTSALKKIDKINLNAILLYINRSDISDFLFIIKLFFFLADIIPGFSLLFFMFFSLIGLILCIKPIQIIRWVTIFLVTCGFLSVISGFGLIIYIKYMLPSNIYTITLSLPLQSSVILAYINDCLLPISISFLISAMFLFGLSFLVYYLPKFFPILFRREILDDTKHNQRFLMNSVYIIVLLLAVSSIVYKYDATKKVFNDNDFSIALSKLNNTNTITKVIPAKNEAIYGLNIKLLDSDTKIPITNIPIRVNGKSNLLKLDFNITSITDSAGTANFKLDKGTFQINFSSNNFPTDYQIPSPFFYYIKSVGTTIITINLQKVSEASKQKLGLAEIEILDKDNLPVPNIELYVESPVFSPGLPDYIYSYTNSEGIALFKINEGEHKINFVEAKFPIFYKLPPPFNITISYNSLNRYTIKLVASK